MKLSLRLAAVAAMVPSGEPVTDIGTDHAYIPIALIEDGRIPSATASDIGRGPIGRARANIEAHGLSGRIRTVLCDGVPPGEPEGTLVLAGMGGILMSRILSDARERLNEISVIVGEPQSDPDLYRRTLAELGFRITDEAFLKEDGKYYAVIKAERTDKPVEPMTGAGLLYGPVLIKKGEPLFREYLIRQRQVFGGILKKLDEADQAADHPRRLEIYERIALADEALAQCGK